MNTLENSTKKTISFIFFMFVLLSTLFVMNWRVIRPAIKLTTQEQKITIDKNIIDIISAGNRRFVSSIYWIETLMDSDLIHYQKNDLGNWMFNRFDTITSLDPEFYEAYIFGGIYLSIVKDDEKGAKIIYEKGLKQFPDDLELLYNAGFNDYFELDNVEDALQKFDKIAKSEEGFKKYPFIVSLGKKLQLKNGLTLEEAYESFKNLYETNKNISNKRTTQYYKNTLYGLKAEIDLKCLNTKSNNCDQKDFEGQPYIYDQTTKLFKARKEYKKFELGKVKKN